MSDAVRYRCTQCGNKTRFDIYETVRRRRFEHFTLGGESSTEHEDILEREIDRVVCHWCERSDTVERI